MAMFTNPQQVAQRGQAPVLALVPNDNENSIANAKIGPDTEFAINQVDWEEIVGAA